MILNFTHISKFIRTKSLTNSIYNSIVCTYLHKFVQGGSVPQKVLKINFLSNEESRVSTLKFTGKLTS